MQLSILMSCIGMKIRGQEMIREIFHRRGEIKTSSDKRWELFQRVGSIVTILALLVTFVGVWFQIRSQKPRAELQVLSTDRLTLLPDIPGLESQFVYLGNPVRDLWKLKIRFLNSGETTIIGQGNAKDILGKGIRVKFPSGIKMLKTREESASFPYRLVHVGDNELRLEFSQWRQGETLVSSIYLSSNQIQEYPPLPTVPDRDIIDGDLLVRDLSVKGLAPPRSLLTLLPKTVTFAGRILAILLASGVVIITIGLFAGDSIGDIVMHFRYFQWKKKHFAEFSKYVGTLDFSHSKFTKKDIIETPWFLEKTLWGNFPGPSCPFAPFTTLYGALGETILWIIVIAAALAVIANSIVIYP